MNTNLWDSLLRVARWGRERGKVNVIADLDVLCAMGDEIDRLRDELATAKAQIAVLADGGGEVTP